MTPFKRRGFINHGSTFVLMVWGVVTGFVRQRFTSGLLWVGGTVFFKVYIEVILGLYWENGK